MLSALFHKAAELQQTGDDEQKAGVSLFRHALSRFVTMGSPLDKVAFLFKKRSLVPWPDTGRRALLIDGETLASKDPAETEWWVNFYHVLDPVSGALDSSFICGDQPPTNIHIRSGLLPGFAHVAYWKDRTALRFILGRTYGTDYLRDKEYRPWSPAVLSALAAMAYLAWAFLLVGAAYALFRLGTRSSAQGVKSGAQVAYRLAPRGGAALEPRHLRPDPCCFWRKRFSWSRTGVVFCRRERVSQETMRGRYGE